MPLSGFGGGGGVGFVLIFRLKTSLPLSAVKIWVCQMPEDILKWSVGAWLCLICLKLWFIKRISQGLTAPSPSFSDQLYIWTRKVFWKSLHKERLWWFHIYHTLNSKLHVSVRFALLQPFFLCTTTTKRCKPLNIHAWPIKLRNTRKEILIVFNLNSEGLYLSTRILIIGMSTD